MVVVIRLKNLSRNANPSDIHEFFKKFKIPNGGVQIMGGEDGIAFILFNSEEDARRALQLDGGVLCGTAIRLTLSNRAEMDQMIEETQRTSSNDELINVQQGSSSALSFPPSVTTPVVPEVVVPPDAFQPQQHKQTQKPRLTESKVKSNPRKNELNDKDKEIESKKKRSRKQKKDSNVKEESKSASNKGRINERKFCVRMSNVRYDASNNDIKNFFQDIEIPYDGIVFLAKGGKNTGHVFLRLASAEDAMKAKKMNKKSLKGRSVIVMACKVQELKNVWKNVLPEQTFPEHIFNKKVPRSHYHHAPFSNLLAQKVQHGGASAPAPYPYSVYEKRPRVEGILAPPASAASFSYSVARKVPRGEATFYSEPPSSSSVQVRMFGLSPAVTKEDIMEFFRDFHPLQESIKLMVDRQGCMTGEGILRFNSPNNARDAVKNLHNRHLLNGPIRLQLD